MLTKDEVARVEEFKRKLYEFQAVRFNDLYLCRIVDIIDKLQSENDNLKSKVEARSVCAECGESLLVFERGIAPCINCIELADNKAYNRGLRDGERNVEVRRKEAGDE